MSTSMTPLSPGSPKTFVENVAQCLEETGALAAINQELHFTLESAPELTQLQASAHKSLLSQTECAMRLFDLAEDYFQRCKALGANIQILTRDIKKTDGVIHLLLTRFSARLLENAEASFLLSKKIVSFAECVLEKDLKQALAVLQIYRQNRYLPYHRARAKEFFTTLQARCFERNVFFHHYTSPSAVPEKIKTIIERLMPELDQPSEMPWIFSLEACTHQSTVISESVRKEYDVYIASLPQEYRNDIEEFNKVNTQFSTVNFSPRCMQPTALLQGIKWAFQRHLERQFPTLFSDPTLSSIFYQALYRLAEGPSTKEDPTFWCKHNLIYLKHLIDPAIDVALPPPPNIQIERPLSAAPLSASTSSHSILSRSPHGRTLPRSYSSGSIAQHAARSRSSLISSRSSETSHSSVSLGSAHSFISFPSSPNPPFSRTPSPNPNPLHI